MQRLIYIILLLQLIEGSDLLSQSTFSKRYNFNFPNTIFNGVAETETGFVIAGFHGDSLNPFLTPMHFTKVDFEGNVLIHETYGGFNDREFWLNAEDLLKTDAGDWLAIGRGDDLNNWERGFLVWFSEQGDTLKTVSLQSPYYGLEDNIIYSWCRPTDLAEDSEGNLYVSAQLFHPETANDFILWKLDSEGEEIWNILYATEEGQDNCEDLWLGSDNSIFVSALEFQPNLVNQIIHYSSEGEIIDQDTIGDGGGRVYEVLRIEDRYYIPSVKVNNSNRMKPRVYSTNLSGDVIWDVTAGFNYAPIYQLQNFEKIVESHDGKLIVAGQFYTPFGEYSLPDGWRNWSGYLVKMDLDGEIIWERTYSLVNSPGDFHLIHDLAATSDGGYIFCGEANDQYLGEGWVNEYNQQGWLVKVDECGCLVPGCDPDCQYTSIGELEEKGNKTFIVGPNPLRTGESLNIYLFENPKNASFRLFDLNGREIDQFIPENGNTTYIWNPKISSPGMYLLVYEDEGHREEVKILVE